MVLKFASVWMNNPGRCWCECNLTIGPGQPLIPHHHGDNTQAPLWRESMGANTFHCQQLATNTHTQTCARTRTHTLARTCMHANRHTHSRTHTSTFWMRGWGAVCFGWFQQMWSDCWCQAGWIKYIRNCWSPVFFTPNSLECWEYSAKNNKHPTSGSSEGENVLLMGEVRGEWPHWF